MYTHSMHVKSCTYLVVDEGIEKTDGVGSSSHTCNNSVRQLAMLINHLLAGLLADDRLMRKKNVSVEMLR
jgi:hypothetical protein